VVLERRVAQGHVIFGQHDEPRNASHVALIPLYGWSKVVTQKEHARNLLNAAVRRGRIQKPSKCSQCGKTLSRFHIQAHHADHALPYDVVWVCATCHAQLDGTMARGWRRNRTYCIKGHEYTPDNIYWERGKWRQCRICKNALWNRAYKARREGNSVVGVGKQV